MKQSRASCRQLGASNGHCRRELHANSHLHVANGVKIFVDFNFVTQTGPRKFSAIRYDTDMRICRHLSRLSQHAHLVPIPWRSLASFPVSLVGEPKARRSLWRVYFQFALELASAEMSVEGDL